MMSTSQYLSPNVIAGTNFNVERFEELYRWVEACRTDSLRIGQPAYGLMCDETGDSGLELSLSGDILQLRKCFAVTKAGSLIGVEAGTSGILELKIAPSAFGKSDVMEIHLVCAPEEQRRLVGKVDHSEIPLRAPFSLPNCRLELHPSGALPDNADTFKIGEIRWTEEKISLTEYLPACIENGAHPILWKNQPENIKQLKSLYHALIAIVQNTDTVKQELIVTRFSRFCEEIGRCMALQISTLKTTGHKSDPRILFDIYRSLAEVIKFEWYIRKSYDTDLWELITYNTRSTVVTFDFNVVESLASHVPEEENAGETLTLIRKFNDHFTLPMLNVSKRNRILTKHKKSDWETPVEKEEPKPPPPKKNLLW